MNNSNIIDKWIPLPEYPIGVEDCTVCNWRDNLIVSCGFNTGNRLCKAKNTKKMKGEKYIRGFKKDTFMFNIDKNTWERLPDFPGPERQALRSINYKDKIYMWGGFKYIPQNKLDPNVTKKWPRKEGLETFSDGYCLSYNDSDGKFEWNKIIDMPYKSSGFLLFSDKNIVYLVTGGTIFDLNEDHQILCQKNNGNTKLVCGDNGLYKLNIDKMNEGWTKITTFPGTPRLNASGGLYKNVIYIIGGMNAEEKWYYGSKYSRFYGVYDNWKYDILNNKWTRIVNNLYNVFNFGGFNQTLRYKNYIILMGGALNENTKYIIDNNIKLNLNIKKLKKPNDKSDKSIIIYDINRNKIYDTASILPISIHNVPSFVHNNEIYIVGGEYGPEQYYNDRYYAIHIDLFCKAKILL